MIDLKYMNPKWGINYQPHFTFSLSFFVFMLTNTYNIGGAVSVMNLKSSLHMTVKMMELRITCCVF